MGYNIICQPKIGFESIGDKREFVKPSNVEIAKSVINSGFLQKRSIIFL